MRRHVVKYEFRLVIPGSSLIPDQSTSHLSVNLWIETLWAGTLKHADQYEEPSPFLR